MNHHSRTLVMRLATLSCLVVFATCAFAQSASDLSGQGQKAYTEKNYSQSADLFLQAYRADPKRLTDLYNAACSFALEGKTEAAFDALMELGEKGYNNPDQLKGDTDFASIKNDPRWAGIVAKIEDNAKKNPPRKFTRFVKPFKTLPIPTETALLESHLGPDNTAMWVDGDVLTFLIKTEAKTVQLTGGIQEPMKQIPGTDLWILQLQMQGWDKAIISYGFILPDTPTDRVPTMHEWRGPKAPAEPTSVESLQGQVLKRTIHSKALDEDRELFIYLPPNAPSTGLPAVFLADGESCESFAKVLEPLITSGQVRPCAIVGVSNGGYRGKRGEGYDPSLDFRAKEYVPGDDPERFDKHLQFFTHEVLDYVSKEFGISRKRQDLAVTGYSNGGAFSAAVAFRNPDFFGTSMPLSLGIPPEDPKPAHPLPRMFFAGGTLEPFGTSTNDVYELVKSWGVECSMDFYVAGHDSAMWDLAFSRLVPKVFPPK